MVLTSSSIQCAEVSFLSCGGWDELFPEAIADRPRFLFFILQAE